MVRDKKSKNQSDEILKDAEDRGVQHLEEVYLPTKVSSPILMVQGCMEGDQSRNRQEKPSFEAEMIDGKDAERGVNDFLQSESSVHITRNAIRDCELQEKSDRLVKRKDVVVID